MRVDRQKRLFVAGTDTGVGKTLVAGMLAVAMKAAYWKPVQTGSREESDASWAGRVCGVPRQRIYPEAYSFSEPVSPHLAARLEGRTIDLSAIAWPESDGMIIAEGAGGIMVPLNEKEFILDLIIRLAAPVLVVARSGLGTINHTLLTVDRLRYSGAEVRGVVLNGEPNPENRKAIQTLGRVEVVAEIGNISRLSPGTLGSEAERHFSDVVF